MTVDTVDTRGDQQLCRYARNEDHCEEVVHLGFHINAKGVSPISSKLEIIQNWPVPTSLKMLRGFLGFVNRYFSFYPNLAIVSAPLARATGKKAFAWSADLQAAFDRTKTP